MTIKFDTLACVHFLLSFVLHTSVSSVAVLDDDGDVLENINIIERQKVPI